MLAVLLGLGSSVAWGVADFLGGLKSRQLALLAVVLGSQAAGLALITGIIAVRAEGPPGGDFAAWAALSGVAGAAGLAAFYRGLAVGAMSVVAPISATAALVPVSVGVATGDRPSVLQALGVALALAGVVGASRETQVGAQNGPGETSQPPAAGGQVAAGAGLAIVAALGFGLFFVGMDAASDGDVLWAILVNRLASVTVLGVTALALRPPLNLNGGDVRALALIGVLDITANALFALASTEGLVSVVSVLGSLYPVTTVVLARAVLHERIGRLQQVGVAAALAGVALISVG